MQKFTSFLKEELLDWKKGELILLCVSLVTIIASAIIFKSDALSLVCSILLAIGVLLSAKGKVSSLVLSLFGIILYGIVSYREQLYGEIIVSVVLMIPLCVYGIISWLRHHNEETKSIQINRIGSKELVILICVAALIFVFVYFLLAKFNTKNLFVSTLSVSVSLLAAYLEARRSRACYYFYILNDLVLMLLWSLPAFSGNFTTLIIAIEATVNLISDSYGLINWKILEDKQQDKAKA